MKKQLFLKLKSDNGFTIMDLIIAIAIFALFAGIIGSLMVTVFKVQSDSQVDEVGTLYAIQIAEYIDKISFDKVETGMGNSLAQMFNIPSNFTVTISVEDVMPEGKTVSLVKKVNINLEYSFANDSRNIYIQRLKIKEL